MLTIGAIWDLFIAYSILQLPWSKSPSWSFLLMVIRALHIQQNPTQTSSSMCQWFEATDKETYKEMYHEQSSIINCYIM